MTALTQSLQRNLSQAGFTLDPKARRVMHRSQIRGNERIN